MIMLFGALLSINSTMLAQDNSTNIDTVINKIVQRIASLSTTYPHLKDFDYQAIIENSIKYQAIHYSYHTSWIDNANYEQEAKELKEANRAGLIPRIPRTISKYDAYDGIAININFLSPEQLSRVAKAIYPNNRYKEFVIDINVEGENTDQMNSLKRDIDQIIKEETK